jgi:hypothetical protein
MTIYKLIQSVVLGFIVAYLLTNALINAYGAAVYLASPVVFAWSPIIYLTAIAAFIAVFLCVRVSIYTV